MKRTHTSILILLMLFVYGLSITQALAQDPRSNQAGVEPPKFERTGQSGFQFLHLPTTARYAALAGIRNGVTNNDVMAIFQNPANLVDVNGFDAAFSNISYVADIQYNVGAVAKRFGRIGVLGVQIANLDIGTMYRTENVYNEQFGITERSGDLGTFTAGDFLVGLSYARVIADRLSIGGNFNYIQESLAETKVNNFSADFGIFYYTGFRSLRLSMTARNLGPDREYTGFTSLYGLPQSVRMPINFRLGLGYDFLEGKGGNPHKLTGYLEGVHPNDGPERIHIAGEYEFMHILSLRGGYRFNYSEQGLTAGAGIKFSFANILANVDYAYLGYGRLSSVHLFTIGFSIE